MALSRGARFIITFMLVAIAVSVGGVLAIFFLASQGPDVRSGSVLWLRVPPNLTEHVSDNLIGQLVSGRRDTLTSVVDTLRKAKVDDRVEAVVLIPPLQSGQWGKVQEIRNAVIDFRESGKPVVAYLEYGSGQQYYLATAADEVFMTPTSSLDLIGVSSFDLFLRGVLDKAGIQPDMLHAGDFKTASNLYTETTYTPEHREMSESLNRDIYDQLVSGISSERSLSEADVRRVIDQGPLLPEEALSQGLVDDLIYEDQIKERLPLPEDKLNLITHTEYQQFDSTLLGLDLGPEIAVIYVVGTINFGGSGIDITGSEVAGSADLVQAIRAARDDDSVQAIVLRIDSPGGAAIASDIIWREVDLAQEKKPVIASMSDVAASGGYYIAAPANVVVAQPGTITGSIGVVAGKLTYGGTLEKLGVGVGTVSDGEMAAMNSPFIPYSDESRARVQNQIDAVYDTFLNRVSVGRGMEVDEVHALAQGRVWTGRQAKELGLVDELGGMREALAVAKDLAGIDVDQEVTVVQYPRPLSFFEALNSEFSLRSTLASWLASPSDRLQASATLPMRLFRPGEPLALLPVSLLPDGSSW